MFNNYIEIFRSRLLSNKLIAECEKLSGRTVASRRLLDQADFKVTVPKGDDLLQFDVSVEKLITSSRPIEQIKVKYDGELPDLYPIKYTISLPKKNIYTTETFYRKICLHYVKANRFLIISFLF